MLQCAAARSRGVARTCRHFGISLKSFYKWKKRYDAHGEAGLCDRPRPPHRSPRATSREVVSKILYLRQRYHFGPGKIADYLQRFHDVAVARSSVHRILGKHGMNQLLDKDGVTDDIHLFNDKLREWEDYHNYHRPHGALDGQTPYERLLAKTRAGVSPAS